MTIQAGGGGLEKEELREQGVGGARGLLMGVEFLVEMKMYKDCTIL